MTIKIDLEKAYDRINWDFLWDTLSDVGFLDWLIQIIKVYVSSPSMHILWNGLVSESFTPSKGLREGDPLSPYLFVLCIKRVTHCIQAVVENGLWKPIAIKRLGPKISHLLFVDDLLIFVETSLDQVNIIKKCLQIFYESSS